MNTEKLMAVAATRLKYLGKIRLITIDDWVFRLHYQVTFIAFLASSGILAWTEFVSKPIECIKGGDVPDSVLNNFCWIEGTYTLPKAIAERFNPEADLILPRDAHPGVHTYVEGGDEEVKGHAYYQWVTLVLFLQALSFYVTHEVWKRWEKGTIKLLVQELNLHALAEDAKKEKKNYTAKWLYNHRGQNEIWALKYITCEVFNLINVIIQLFIIDWFVGGEFWNYGYEVLYYIFRNQWERDDPMVRVFPKITKCTFRQYGPSGDPVKFDNLCLLPLNILNEKIYIVLWFWLIILLIIQTLWLLFWRLPLLLSPAVRFNALMRLSPLFNTRKAGLNKQREGDPSETIKIICERLSYGDWFLVYMLGWNLHSLHFKEVLEELGDRLDDHSIEYVADTRTLEATNESEGSEKKVNLPTKDDDSEKKQTNV